MSNAINDNEDEEKGKKELLGQKDTDDGIEDNSKTKLILVYAATVGGMLLIVIVVFLIALKFGGTNDATKSGSDSKTDISPSSTCTFYAKYSQLENNTVAKLFNPKYVGYISSMKIDGKNVDNIVSYYNFSRAGNHSIELEFKDNLEFFDFFFNDCPSLVEVNISTIAAKKITTMRGLFQQSRRLTKVSLGKNFTTSEVTDMREMFQDCTSLKELDISNLDTSKVANMNKMFYNCINLESIDISSFKTNKVNDMSYLFYGCTNLKSLDLSKLDTSNVENMEYMFAACSELKSLDLNGFNTKKVKNMNNMFYRLSSVESLDVSTFVTSEVTNMGGMFDYCTQLKSLDLSNFDTSNV
jgi:surface protein